MFRTAVLVFAILVVSVGCGGGGGSDECNDSVACIQPEPATIVDSKDLFGKYDIRYDLLSNSCAGAVPLQLLHEEYEVTPGFGYHGYPTIEVSSSTGPNYSAYSSVDNTDGKTYFSNANENGEQELLNFISNMHCAESILLNFSNVGQLKASITRISYIDCAKLGETIVQGVAQCQVVYSGEGTFSPR